MRLCASLCGTTTSSHGTHACQGRIYRDRERRRLAMQDLACGLRRMVLPRTPVYRGAGRTAWLAIQGGFSWPKGSARGSPPCGANLCSSYPGLPAAAIHAARQAGLCFPLPTTSWVPVDALYIADRGYASLLTTVNKGKPAARRGRKATGLLAKLERQPGCCCSCVPCFARGRPRRGGRN